MLSVRVNQLEEVTICVNTKETIMYYLYYYIIIYGIHAIPEKIGEDLEDIMEEVAKKIKVNVESIDINNALIDRNLRYHQNPYLKN